VNKQTSLTQVSEFKHLKRWTYPESYIGESYDDYFRTGIGQSRDSQALERSNFVSMIKALGGESETVIVVRAGHWACGWVESILIHESDLKALKTANEIMEALQDYPVIDECHFSETEQEELQDTIKAYSSDFEETVLSLVGIDSTDDLSSAEQDELTQFISNVMQEDQSYRGVDDAFVTEASIERYTKSWEAKHDDLNLTALVIEVLGGAQ
jgi:hypothetical protein